MVPGGRVELPLSLKNRILSPARLPVPPSGQLLSHFNVNPGVKAISTMNPITGQTIREPILTWYSKIFVIPTHLFQRQLFHSRCSNSPLIHLNQLIPRPTSHPISAQAFLSDLDVRARINPDHAATIPLQVAVPSIKGPHPEPNLQREREFPPIACTPKTCPGPRIFKSSSANANPSSNVANTASRRFAVDRETSAPTEHCGPWL